MSRASSIDEAMAETILLAMKPSVDYDASDVADILDIPATTILRLMRKLEDRGDLIGKRVGKNRFFQKRVKEMIAARVAPVEAKPLTGYDLGQHMRLCQGSRKPDTGMT